MTSSAASDTDRARNTTSGSSGLMVSSTALPPPPGRWTSSRTTSGWVARMPRHGGLDISRLAEDLDGVAELRPHTGAEHLVVVDQEDAGHGHDRGTSSTTSVPSSGAVCTSARPPWRAMRPMIDSRTPTRPGSTASSTKPLPRSRT